MQGAGFRVPGGAPKILRFFVYLDIISANMPFGVSPQCFDGTQCATDSEFAIRVGCFFYLRLSY